MFMTPTCTMRITRKSILRNPECTTISILKKISLDCIEFKCLELYFPPHDTVRITYM